jgi:hypothetical protein
LENIKNYKIDMKNNTFLISIILFFSLNSAKVMSQEAIIKPQGDISLLVLNGVGINEKVTSFFCMGGIVRKRIGGYLKVKSELFLRDDRFAIVGGGLLKVEKSLFVHAGLGYGFIDNRIISGGAGSYLKIESGKKFTGIQYDAGVLLKLKKILFSIGTSSIVNLNAEDFVDELDYLGDAAEINIGIGIMF